MITIESLPYSEMGGGAENHLRMGGDSVVDNRIDYHGDFYCRHHPRHAQSKRQSKMLPAFVESVDIRFNTNNRRSLN